MATAHGAYVSGPRSLFGPAALDADALDADALDADALNADALNADARDADALPVPGAAAGTPAPHSLQKRAPAASAAPQRPHPLVSNDAPHWLQNLPVERAPHDGHVALEEEPEGERLVIECERRCWW